MCQDSLCCAWKSAEASQTLKNWFLNRNADPRYLYHFHPVNCAGTMDCLHCAQLRGRQIQKIIFSYCEYSHIYLGMYEKENMVPHLSSKCQASKWLNKGNAPKPPPPHPNPSQFGAWQSPGERLAKCKPGPNKHVLYSQQIKSGFRF